MSVPKTLYAKIPKYISNKPKLFLKFALKKPNFAKHCNLCHMLMIAMLLLFFYFFWLVLVALVCYNEGI